MRCVVTGGCGFIGSHVVDRLVADKHDVAIIDDLTTGTKANLNAGAELVEGSILDADLVQRVTKGADVVFHLAAWARVPRSVEDPVGTHRVNVDGTLQVLQAARLNKVPRVVYSSSSSVYGDQDSHIMRENLSPNPKSPYAMQKLMGEQYAGLFAKLFNLSVVSLRYFNVYGPRQLTEGAYALVIGKFLRMRAAGEPLTVFGDGEQTRAYTHVSDVADANMRAAQIEIEPGRHCICNVGTEREITVNEIANRIGGEIHRIIPNPRGEFEELRKTADISWTKSILGWEPRVEFEDGLAALM